MNLSELELHLLYRLASATVTDSAVALAAELWEGWTSPFTYDMVAWVLQYLNEQGLVVYTLGASSVPVRIRVTQEGYVALGYTQRHQIVAQLSISRHRGDPIRPGDRTDFRSHLRWAEWAPCERLTIAEHNEKYPDHRHTGAWRGRVQENEMARGIATPPETRSRIDELHAAGIPIPDIATQVGLSYFTVYDQVRRPKATKATEGIEPTSTKGRTLKAIVDRAQFDTVAELAAYLRREHDISVGGHELVHLLYSLNKEGLIRFIEQKRGSAAKELVRIRSTAVARKMNRANGHAVVAVGAPIHRTDRTDYRTHGVKAVGGPIERAHVETPVIPPEQTATLDEGNETLPLDDTPSPSAEPVVDTPASVVETPDDRWPELDRLRERVTAMANREVRLDALVKAAESLRDIDANAHLDLMKRAERVADETVTMTPTETEYLRYAASVQRGHDDDSTAGS